MTRSGRYLYDPIADEVVAVDELRRRQSLREPRRTIALLVRKPQRGRWIFDRTTQKLVPAGEFYVRKYAGTAASDLAAPMVIADVQPYQSVIDGSVIGGRRQHREHLRANGCVELGNEVVKRRPHGPVKGEIAASVKRAMEDPNLRAEALHAERRAKETIK